MGLIGTYWAHETYGTYGTYGAYWPYEPYWLLSFVAVTLTVFESGLWRPSPNWMQI